VASETDPSGRTRRYVRDALGQVIRVERPGDRWSEYAYDASGRVVKVTHAGGTELRYRYRADGEMIEAIGPDTAVSFQRDELGRVVREARDGMWVGSEYGPKDVRTRIFSSFGADQRIDRTVMGDATRVSDGAFLATFAVDGFGLELERTLPGGIKSRWDRDALGREVQQTITRGDRALRTRKLRWGPDDRLNEVDDSRHGVTRHGHDVTGGHAWTQHPGGEVALKLPNAVGDRFCTPDRTDRRYGPSGELLWADGPDGRTTWRYDDEGMLAEKIAPSGATWRFSWNGAGMLAAVERPDGEIVRFQYDAIGRRIAKTIGTTTHHTLWDGDVPLHEWTTEDGETTGPTTSWIFEPETCAPLGKRVDDEVFGIVTDHLGTPQAMFDAAGEMVWVADVDPWGRLQRLEGDAQACPFRWPGQREDAETGLHYNRFRYYDPDAGIYVSPDPIGWLGGLRPYAYADDVLSGCDPFGLKSANKAQGDAGEAAAKKWLEENDNHVLGSMENKSGHGVDIVYRTPEGDIEVAEVKTNGSALNKDQKKGADSLAQSRADRCLRQKGAWKSGKKGSRKLAKKVMRQVAEKGAVQGLVFKYDVDANGVKLRDGYPKRWKACK
jgi:RHS repeat-associated protein